MIHGIDVGAPGADGMFTITLRGEPIALMTALVHGLPHDVLLTIQAALDEELAARRPPQPPLRLVATTGTPRSKGSDGQP